MNSPYISEPQSHWLTVTQSLIDKHPLSSDVLVEVVLSSWEDIFASRIGRKGYLIGIDILPSPQILGFFLHELIPLEIARRFPGLWTPERSSRDKDLVYLPDDFYSIEIKTSSNPRSIFGNRSYSQASSTSKKSKSGYYLAVNFEKCEKQNPQPRILRIRFGWLDHSDWTGQKSETGQQARLSPEIERTKLLEIYSAAR